MESPKVQYEIVGVVNEGVMPIFYVPFADLRSLGVINITYIPWKLSFLITLISLLVGIFTGIYPAMRAQRISALNALRYE